MIIKINYGKIERIDKESYKEYFGITYVKPSATNLHFYTPEESYLLEGVYQAIDFRNRCM